jgi:uncharacterized RDD family membrane protein YckC
MSRYVVRTPENVVFEYEIAGPATRANAWLLDRLIVGAATGAAGAAVQLVDGIAEGLGSALWLVVYFVLDWGYHAGFEWRWGKTPGKSLMGLRVMSDRGLRITFGQSAVRNIFRILDSLPGVYLLGGAVAATDSLGRRTGDVAAGTLVVREPPRRSIKGLVSPGRGRTGRVAPLADADAARVRRRITPAQRDAVLALSIRREELDLPVRVGLFRDLSEVLQERLGVPRSAGLSPENHVLRIAAALT